MQEVGLGDVFLFDFSGFDDVVYAWVNVECSCAFSVDEAHALTPLLPLDASG